MGATIQVHIRLALPIWAVHNEGNVESVQACPRYATSFEPSRLRRVFAQTASEDERRCLEPARGYVESAVPVRLWYCMGDDNSRFHREDLSALHDQVPAASCRPFEPSDEVEVMDHNHTHRHPKAQSVFVAQG